ncbi:sensor histidine kinase [Geminicoccus flavidas]|uniref:sensor histidine kinase n=1 Tax=Geminicoccus flavidas TaxID=2506407 RepID=UPI001356D9A3|nr:sensor histidine kinase [Geminicoccus flavidas]
MLEQKDLLLREIDHRVKNSLALVAGLLGMQERSTASAEAKAVLAAASARLMSIARIHEQLYRSGDIASVAFDDYLTGLCNDVVASLSQPEQVTFTLKAGHFVLPTDQAVRLGLIAVELLTNALRHACRPGQRTRIRLDCRQEDGGLLLVITDNGPRLPKGFDAGKSRGLGLRLVCSLVHQLGGTLEADRLADGARFRVRVNGTGSACACALAGQAASAPMPPSMTACHPCPGQPAPGLHDGSAASYSRYVQSAPSAGPLDQGRV